MLVFAYQLPLLLSVAIDVLVAWGFKVRRLATPCPTPRAGPFQRTPPSSAGAPWTLHIRVESGELPPEPCHTKLGSISPALTGEKGSADHQWWVGGCAGTKAVPQQSRRVAEPDTPGGGAPNNLNFQLRSPKGRLSEVVVKGAPRCQRELHFRPGTSPAHRLVLSGAYFVVRPAAHNCYRSSSPPVVPRPAAT